MADVGDRVTDQAGLCMGWLGGMVALELRMLVLDAMVLADPVETDYLYKAVQAALAENDQRVMLLTQLSDPAQALIRSLASERALAAVS